MKIVVGREEFYAKVEKVFDENFRTTIIDIFESTLKHYNEEEDVFLCINCGRTVDVTSAYGINDVMHVCPKCIGTYIKNLLEEID